MFSEEEKKMIELLASVGEELESQDDAGYKVNKTQLRKLRRVYNWFAEKYDADPLKLVPHKERCSVSVHDWAFDFCGDDLTELLCILQDASTVYIDARDDGLVNIEILIPGVFEKIDNWSEED